MLFAIFFKNFPYIPDVQCSWIGRRRIFFRIVGWFSNTVSAIFFRTQNFRMLFAICFFFSKNFRTSLAFTECLRVTCPETDTSVLFINTWLTTLTFPTTVSLPLQELRKAAPSRSLFNTMNNANHSVWVFCSALQEFSSLFAIATAFRALFQLFTFHFQFFPPFFLFFPFLFP